MKDRRCSNCDYDLSGLAARGKCPECGQFFNVLSGEGLGGKGGNRGRASRSLSFAARLRTITLALFTVAVLGCGGIASMWASNPFRPVAIACLIAGIGAMAAVASYLSEKEEA